MPRYYFSFCIPLGEDNKATSSAWNILIQTANGSYYNVNLQAVDVRRLVS